LENIYFSNERESPPFPVELYSGELITRIFVWK